MEGDVVRESLWRRFCGSLRRFFLGLPRNTSATEVELMKTVQRLNSTVADRDRRILDLRTEVEELKSTVKIRDHQVELLADVVARDRTRVQSETAVFARQVGEVLNPPRQ
jgi:hypothetical protein